jgi:hypothetical protein
LILLYNIHAYGLQNHNKGVKQGKIIQQNMFLKNTGKLIQSTHQNAIHMMDNPAQKLIKSLYMKLSRDMEDI